MKSLAVFWGLILSFLAAIPAFASPASFETEVINDLKIGDISIDLAEYELDDAGREVPGRYSQTVLPGQVIRKIIRITNRANPAWIRVRPEFVKDGELFAFPGSLTVSADERWILRGDAWYLTSALACGEEADFIEEFRIPAFWGDAEAGSGFKLIITAEAVQEANFDPDFDSADPWFGTLIETCVHSGARPDAPRHDTFSLSFEGGAEGLVKTGDDFFANFGHLMPGDEVSDSLIIKNGYAKPVEIYFRTEGRADDILAGKIRLIIQGSAGVIFDGSLSESREEIRIAALKKGTEEMITYSVFIPPEADNSSALAATGDKWIFRAQTDDGKKSSSSAGHTGSGGGAISDPPLEPKPAAEFIYPVRELAKTGEGRAVIAAEALMIMAGLSLYIIFRKLHDKDTTTGRCNDERS